MEPLTLCLFTGLDVFNIKENTLEGTTGYSISLLGIQHDFVINASSIYDIGVLTKGKAYLYRSLLLNGKVIPRDYNFLPHKTHTKLLENFMKSISYPQAPKEKLENFFIELSKHQVFAGHNFSFEIPKKDGINYVLKYYFNSLEELYFYLNTLQEKKLIKYSSQTTDSGDHLQVQFTYEGLIELISLTEEGINSNRCFVAMSFQPPEKFHYTDVIKPVIQQFGFQPIKVDELQTQADQTINDLIIAEIKKSKFLIADFAGLRGGVYYEAGYAAGRGKKVIYACPNSEKGKLHFDVKHFSFILYDDLPDFKRQLINKIQAYILD